MKFLNTSSIGPSTPNFLLIPRKISVSSSKVLFCIIVNSFASFSIAYKDMTILL